MSDIEEKQDSKTDKRRRRHRDAATTKNPIKVVSSLGEGTLIDRFQSAVSEKKERKQRHEKSGRTRHLQKEKRQRDVAKFKAEIDALMEADPPALKPSEKMTTFVPKLRGTVKGKFEELEKRKQEEERKKAENERKKRTEKDIKDKKMIEIEIAKRKLQEKQNLESDNENTENILQQKKSPGKLNADRFEEMTRQKEEKEKKKAEIDRRMKMEAELRAFKEMNLHNKQVSDEDSSDQDLPIKSKPNRLSTRFDEIARAHEEEQRRKAEEESRERLAEEKINFKEQKLAAQEGSSESEKSETVQQPKPRKLSPSFTNFNEIAKVKMDEERRRIKERRKKLLEEEMKIFEESRRNLEQQESSSEDSGEHETNYKHRRPQRLDSSFTKFDIAARQKLQDKREEIQKERARLLEDEKQMFTEERKLMNGSSQTDGTSVTSSISGGSDEGEKRTKKLTKRRKKVKTRDGDEGPSKLDNSKLNFDVLERQRMEKERWNIQEQRRKLLEEEKRIFEEARKQRLENQQQKENGSKVKSSQSPSKLEYSKTRFDIMAQHKMEEEKQRIREERSRLLREEKRLFEEERKRMEMEQGESKIEKPVEVSSTRTPKKPSRLDKSFTEFDILSKRKKEEERERIMRESRKKLEEENKLFREAKKMMDDSSLEDADSENEIQTSRISPGKLSKEQTNFEEMEKRRKMTERENIYNEKLRQLSEEKLLFVDARSHQNENSDSDVDDTKSKTAPNKLSSSLTNFETKEKKRIEKERIEAHERKINEIQEELKRFKEERELMNDSDKEERSEVTAPQVAQPRPKKLSTNFTKFDEIARLNQERENVRRKEEKTRKLEEERLRFQASKEQEAESESDDDGPRKQIYRPINKINVRDQMEAVLQAQREAERKRIMETKFCRMTVEQQEMYLAKEAQLNLLREKLAQAEADDSESYTSDDNESDDSDSDGIERKESTNESAESDERQNTEDGESEESTGDSQTSSQNTDESGSSASSDSVYTGAPWFTETLSNITLREGKPVRFDAVIHADPHPKVTWYFKNRLIRNSPDYQYLNKGTQYSLYMNESFYDDSGEYVCKAENSKGVATSKAILTIIGKL